MVVPFSIRADLNSSVQTCELKDIRFHFCVSLNDGSLYTGKSRLEVRSSDQQQQENFPCGAKLPGCQWRDVNSRIRLFSGHQMRRKEFVEERFALGFRDRTTWATFDPSSSSFAHEKLKRYSQFTAIFFGRALFRFYSCFLAFCLSRTFKSNLLVLSPPMRLPWGETLLSWSLSGSWSGGGTDPPLPAL